MVQTSEEICKQKVIDINPQREIENLPKTLQNEIKQYSQISDFIKNFFNNVD